MREVELCVFTSKVGLFASLHVIRGKLDQLLQCLVLDVRGAPFWDDVSWEVATKLHDGRVLVPHRNAFWRKASPESFRKDRKLRSFSSFPSSRRY